MVYSTILQETNFRSPPKMVQSKEATLLPTFKEGKNMKRTTESVQTQVMRILLLIIIFMIMPTLSRLNSFSRNRDKMAYSDIMSGFFYGGAQDFAIAIQAFTMLFTYMQFHSTFLEKENFILFSLIRCLVVVFSLVWASFAVFIDWGLQLHYQPRLNHAFVSLFIKHHDQFASSLTDPELYSMAMVTLQVVYVVSIIGMTLLVVYDFLQVPTISIPAKRCSTKCFFLMSGFIILTLSTFSHAVIMTRMIGGSFINTYCSSNAMFTVEVEKLQIPIIVEEEVDPISSNSTQYFVRQFLGDTENYRQYPEHLDFPFWRKTKSYTGKTRFTIKKKPGKRPNVLFISLESWTANNVGVIGNRKRVKQLKKSITPEFDSLSKGGVLFRRHFTPSIQTSRTLLSKMFGILPIFDTNSALLKYKGKVNYTGMPQTLKKMGYINEFVSGASFKWDSWDEFLKGNAFDKQISESEMRTIARKELKQGVAGTSWGIHDHQSLEILGGEIKKLSRQDKPYYIDYYSVSTHHPHDVPKTYKKTDLHEFETKWNKKYIHSMAYTDKAVGDFIRSMRKDGLMNNTIVIIQGDHGWGSKEHNGGYGNTLNKVYNEAVSIPFLILADDLLEDEFKGKSIDEATSSVDYFATVMDMIGIPESGFWQHGIGHSMMREDETRDVILMNQFGGGSVGVVGKNKKYAFYGNGKIEEFDMMADPFELQPVKASVNKTRIIKEKIDRLFKLNDQVYDTDKFVPPVLSTSSQIHDQK